ncbi:MAG: CHAT domain-containing protein, partial [Myxococcales bacterium]|nr:CHAT domain-containing protein [Myxococcales bacterium]
MSPPLAPTTSPTHAMVVDVLAHGDPATVSVHWPSAGSPAEPIEPATMAQLRRQLDALHEAERDRQNTAVPTTRQALGRTLWHLLDGPSRRLARAMATAQAQDEPLDLIVRLRSTTDAVRLAHHPATTWRWELLSPEGGCHPTADGRLRLAVQLGDAEPAQAPRVLEYGGLRIVFMAYSPRGVEPLLDYEAEEDRILQALERPIREHRAQVEVVEYGTLAELEERLRGAPADVVHLTGHGRLTPEGPRLVMEDELGQPDFVSPEQLLRALRRAAKKPDLVVISSCHSAEGRDGMPSLAATLVDGGIP